jgi:hypothetical protein
VIKATLAGIATAGELRASLSTSTGKAVALLYCELRGGGERPRGLPAAWRMRPEGRTPGLGG